MFVVLIFHPDAPLWVSSSWLGFNGPGRDRRQHGQESDGTVRRHGAASQLVLCFERETCRPLAIAKLKPGSCDRASRSGTESEQGTIADITEWGVMSKTVVSC